LDILSSRLCNRKHVPGDVSNDTPAHTNPEHADVTTSTPRTDDPRVERTRAAVIDAATALMLEDGPGAITHAHVAAAANVSRTTVYTHWPSREDLLRATIDSIRRHKPDTGELTGSLRDDLRAVLAPLITDLCDDQRASMIATMMQRALHDAEVVAVRDEFIREFTTVFDQIIHTAITNADLRAGVDTERALASIVGSFLFQRFMSSTGLDTEAADAVIDDFIELHAPA
jgi:AcrR family transcriptional regulator